MSRWYHSACPKPDCGSSDAFSWKEGDEFGHCFSCGKSSFIGEKENMSRVEKKDSGRSRLDINDILEYPVRGFKERGITKTITDHFGVKTGYDAEGEIAFHYYPYTKGGKISAYKERELPKKFTVHGDFKDVELFGQAQATGGKKLVVTEGEIDAMAVSQAQYDKYQRFYPVVSLASASQVTTLLNQKDFINGFDEVILCFDMDDPGQEAAKKAAKIIGYDKVKICVLPEKDASDVFTKHGGDTLMQCIWNARAYSPAGVVRGEDVWQQYKQRKETLSVPYPKCLQGLNTRLKGMRMGEIVLFTSGTGSGKSTVIKEIVLDLLETTTDMIGMVSLEESIGDTAQKFIAMELNCDMQEASEVTEDDERKAFEKIFSNERLVLLDHQGSVSDDSLLDKIEHLYLMGCKYVILDHITIAVSEGADGKTGNEAVDFIMSSLLKIVKKHNGWLGVISHLRKGNSQQKPFEEGRIPSMDDIKGSGSIKQISFDIIGFARNMVAEDDNEKNTIKFRVLKARFTGNTGNAGQARYNPKTSRLKYLDMNDFEYA
jgi:twinkle protein